MQLMNIRRPKFWIVALSLLTCLGQPAAVAITINMEYSNEGDSVPHDENPLWDPAGVFLKSHFAAAKSIWESLLPGSGDISFDFEWDDDLDATQLGLYSPSIFGDVIEINPSATWFVDPTPDFDFEFGASTQVLYSGLTPAQRATYFPDLTPPHGLEVGFKRAGTAVAGAANGVRADMGFDLLTVILHEIGHALGVNSDTSEPYFFNALHVGGIGGVSVLNDNDSGHLAGDGDLPVLMRSSAPTGERILPSATDVLAIAGVLDINNVRLQRVGRIFHGNWNNTNSWIGADVPDATQDAYVHQAATVTLDVNASVKSLIVSGGSDVDAASFRLAAGDIRFDGGALSAGAGGAISADAIHGDPAQLYTAAGSTIEFNDFTRGASSATAATFNGNVTIGIGSGVPTFNPDTTITAWTIGQDLKIGGTRAAKLVIDNGAWNVGGNLDIQGTKFVESEVVVDGGTLSVTGLVTIGGNGALTYKSHNASTTTYTLYGGSANKFTSPPPTHLETSPAGRMTFENTVSAGAAIINVGGGTGDGGPGAVVTFKGTSYAADAEFWNGSGVGGDSLYLNHPFVIAGTGGRVIFADDSNAYTAHFRNDGVNAHGPTDSGGSTYFRDDSYAQDAVFDNHGSTLPSYIARGAPGGRTEFFDDSSASFGTFNNHPGQGMGALGAGVTIFRGNSTAANGTFYNKGGVPGLQHGGSTEFYDSATAGDADFYNEHSPNLSQHAGTAGNVRFYGLSTAGDATFYNQSGGGTVYFNDASTAGNGTFFIEDTGTGTFSGHVIFQGNSKGGTADITIKENCNGATIEFYGASNAEQAQITLVNGWQGFMRVTNSASLGQANVDVGSGSGGGLVFRESATAADSTIRVRPGGGVDFTGTLTTAADATITLDGATVANGGTGSLNFTGGRAQSCSARDLRHALPGVGFMPI